MLTKLLRWPVPDQIKALLEKIDNEGAALDSSSRKRIRELLDEDFLTRYEKFLLKQGLRKYKRAKALDDAMCIVLNQHDEMERLQTKVEQALISRKAALMANAAQNTTTAMWNGTVHPLQNVQFTDPRGVYGNITK